jgi:serine protease Do
VKAPTNFIRPLFAAGAFQILLAGPLAAQLGDVPLMRPEEAEVVDRQAGEFFEAIRPAARTAMASTVWVWADVGRGERPVAYGTVVGNGSEVLTKWSEIAMARGKVQVVDGDGTTARAKVAGVYEEEDLALLKLEGAGYTPLRFSAVEPPPIGRFLIAATPDETPAGVGVVAVEARSLRTKDQAFLGIRLDPEHEGMGVGILDVEKGSAAEAAGLKGGDVILALDGRSVGNLIELQTVLAGRRPGDALQIRYRRGDAEASATAELQRKEGDFPDFPSGRLRQMESMGAREKALSLVRDDFPSVIQTDLRIGREQCGGPVVDLDGQPVGIAIARADRTRSFVIPARDIVALLQQQPVAPDTVLAAREERERQLREQVGQAAPQGPAPRIVPAPRGAAENLRRHLEEMEALMERMRDEMDSIGEGE